MKCKICDNDSETQIFEVREMMYGYKDIFQYFQCPQCNCLQIKNTPKNISKYYPDNYYSYEIKREHNRLIKYLMGLRNIYILFNKGFIGKIINIKYPNENLRCLSRLPLRKGTRILDVGCGSGKLLYTLRELGFKNLLGVDPFIAKDIEHANGLKIQKKEIHEIKDKWDVIIFFHSFEHITDPAKTMQNVSRLLTPNGHCIVTIPISSSYAWEHYGVNWFQLDAPRHYYLHSVKSMQILADQAKLDLYKVVYNSTSSQFIGSELYEKDIPYSVYLSDKENIQKSIFSKEKINAFEKKARELNKKEQGDQAVFYFRNQMDTK